MKKYPATTGKPQTHNLFCALFPLLGAFSWQNWRFGTANPQGQIEIDVRTATRMRLRTS
jgi:hypothetical protein